MPSPLGRVAEQSEVGRGLPLKAAVSLRDTLFRHGFRRATFPRGEGFGSVNYNLYFRGISYARCG